MSEAGIPNQPDCENSIFPEGNSAEVEQASDSAEQLEDSPTTKSKAVNHFERRIAAVDGSSGENEESLPRLRDADWFSLARKLRQRNRDLLKKVASLEQDLADTQEILQAEIARSRSSETLSAQQTKEFHASQEKIDTLLSELELSHQTAQRQQALVETLSEQLEVAQQRIAHLEQECTLLHQHYDEQAQHLRTAQQQSQELSLRLQRQKRKTLQFKAALDKCLESPGSQQEEPIELPVEIVESPESSASVTAKAQPIQPWSSQSDRASDWSERAPAWVSKALDREDAVSHPDLEENPEFPQQQDSSDSFGTIEGNELVEWELAPLSAETRDANFEETETVEIAVISFNDEPDLQQDLELEEVPEPEVLDFSPSPEEANPSPPVTAQIPSSPNFPSPVVYPKRKQKKLKSLAAVELPQFPRYS
ncbi:hypothetical protein IQ249_23095 [Lusitaniella coriacea LEGE 07157]|uniref:Uncharacterized protein n=1 Tax=Lusitaniella coriacea LEGE 07157 TaxID=945747 RepID=A0A8J7DZX4_9CYAN|nr:hypothetical protein [Lusitaniella coriacea]MBE9118779.1 hypothetical protein [Lusitaniella coriacea LEGE 07157]